MAMTVKDLDDFKRLLVKHPEWRTELRQLILTDELLSLPALVRELVEAQKRTEERLIKVEAAILELVHAQSRTEETMRALAGEQKKMRDDLADHRGFRLEQQYLRRAHAYFGRFVRRIRVILPNPMDAAIEDTLEARLTLEELRDVLLLDILAAGKLRQPSPPEEDEVWLAVEVSAVIDSQDVERAQRRANLLRQAGYRAVPIVAGEGVTPGANQRLQDAPVVLLLDGRIEGWERALAAT